MPFPCAQEWRGSTRASHSPGYWSIDFNRDGDYRMPVVASAAGHVYRVNDVGNTSYGKYVFIDHGNGESTVYAHLDAFRVQQGAYVDQGEVIGLLGNSGGSYGAHLHYEQRFGSTVGRSYFHQVAFPYNTDVRSRNCPQAPLTGDWDGDGTSERAVFKRGRKGVFRLQLRPRTVQRFALGNPTDQVVAGDWDGDGTDEVGVRDQSTRRVTLRDLDGTVRERSFAPRTAELLAGDWDGDGADTLGFYRPARNVFVLRSPSGRSRIFWGEDGGLPITGDWDADGRDDVGVFYPLASEFSLRVIDPSTGQPIDVRVPVTGPADKQPEPEEEPAPDPTVTDPDADPAEPETADVPAPDGEPSPEPTAFELYTEQGLSSSLLPVIGDWNADGRSDLGLWDPATAVWKSWVVNSLERRAATRGSNKFGRPRF